MAPCAEAPRCAISALDKVHRCGAGYVQRTDDARECHCWEPDDSAEKIETIHANNGFRIMVPMTQFGTLPDELVKKSTQMFAEEVAPKLRAL